MKTLRVVLFLAVWLLTHPARGEGVKPVETIPPGPDRIVPLRAGVPAPYAGQLFDNPTALRWANWLSQYKLRLELDVQEQEELCAVKLKAKEDILAARQGACSLAIGACREKVAQLTWEVDHPAWYSSLWFGAVLGAVGVGLVVIVAGNR